MAAQTPRGERSPLGALRCKMDSLERRKWMKGVSPVSRLWAWSRSWSFSGCLHARRETGMFVSVYISTSFWTEPTVRRHFLTFDGYQAATANVKQGSSGWKYAATTAGIGSSLWNLTIIIVNTLDHICFADASLGWGRACAGSRQLSISERPCYSTPLSFIR